VPSRSTYTFKIILYSTPVYSDPENFVQNKRKMGFRNYPEIWWLCFVPFLTVLFELSVVDCTNTIFFHISTTNVFSDSNSDITLIGLDEDLSSDTDTQSPSSYYSTREVIF